MSARERTLLLSSKTDPGHRALVERALDGTARLVHLPDLGTDSARETALREADATISLAIGRELHDPEFALLAGPNRLLQLLSAGADHIPFRKLPDSLTVASNIGAYSEPMAEYVVAATLAFMKRLREGHAELKQGEFNQRTLSGTLNGAVVGIIGYGGIGRATARMMRALGARVIGVNRSGQSEEPPDALYAMDALESVLRKSDVVVLAVPLTRASRDMFGARELSWMKDDAILVNVARGEIIDETALYERLVAYPRFRAAIDAWWVEPIRQGAFEMKHPFLDLPNVIGSPHNSAFVPGFREHALLQGAANAIRFLRGEPVEGLVNRADFLETA